MYKRLLIAFVVLAAYTVGSYSQTSSWVRPQTIAAQNECQSFPETNQQVCGIFLSYWRANGGLAQQGYPISGVFREQSSNGQTYDTQYFERAVFERHPENAGTKYEVLLSLLGSEKLKAKYPNGVPGPAPAVPTPTTAPPPPQPTQVPSGLVVLSTSDYSESGRRYIVGEVLNNTSQNQQYVKVVASLYDTGGNLVGSEYTYTDLDILRPQQKGGFSITISNPPANSTHYQVQVQGRPGDAPLEGLTVRSSGSRAGSSGRRIVYGEVVNNTGGPVQYVKVVATMYDGSGRVVGVDYTYTDLDILQPGQSSPFDMSVERWSGVARFEVAVQGRRP